MFEYEENDTAKTIILQHVVGTFQDKYSSNVAMITGVNLSLDRETFAKFIKVLRDFHYEA